MCQCLHCHFLLVTKGRNWRGLTYLRITGGGGTERLGLIQLSTLWNLNETNNGILVENSKKKKKISKQYKQLQQRCPVPRVTYIIVFTTESTFCTSFYSCMWSSATQTSMQLPWRYVSVDPTIHLTAYLMPPPYILFLFLFSFVLLNRLFTYVLLILCAAA